MNNYVKQIQSDMPIRPTRTSPEKIENIASLPPRNTMIVAPDTRIHELNRRLSSRPADPDNLWYIIEAPYISSIFIVY